MRRLVGILIGLLAPAAFLAATSAAVMQAPSGDTCSATGTGTAYTLVINLPASGVEQGAFAFAARGAKVMRINSPANPGTLSNRSLPANATAGWLLTSAAVPGSSVTASLATSRPVTAFTVIPANARRTTYFDPLVCLVSKVTPVSNRFTVQRQFTYNSATGGWQTLVTVPGPGMLIYNHRTLAPGGTPSPLIQSGKVSTRKAGKLQVTLKPSVAGTAALDATGRIKLNLTIQFSPKGGKPRTQVISLTLSR